MDNGNQIQKLYLKEAKSQINNHHKNQSSKPSRIGKRSALTAINRKKEPICSIIYEEAHNENMSNISNEENHSEQNQTNITKNQSPDKDNVNENETPNKAKSGGKYETNSQGLEFGSIEQQKHSSQVIEEDELGKGLGASVKRQKSQAQLRENQLETDYQKGEQILET